jgi:hypothetical protein
MTKPNAVRLIASMIIVAIANAPTQASDSKSSQNPPDPCVNGIAAFAAKLHTVCFVYAEQAAPDAKPIKALSENDALHAGEQVACDAGSDVTITYCASRADVEVRAAAGFVTTGAKPKRYIIANVPHKNLEEQPDVAAALCIAMAGTTEQQRYFLADTHSSLGPTLAFDINSIEVGLAPDPEQALARLVARVKANKKLAYASLDIDSQAMTHGWIATRDPVGELAYCVGLDGSVTAPKAIAGMHLNLLKDSEGQPFGEALVKLARPDAITTLKTTWHFPGSAPVAVTTYASKVNDLICGINVSTRVPEMKSVIPP